MWSPEGSSSGGENIYENHSATPMHVTTFLHNDSSDRKDVSILVSADDVPIRLAAGESIVFTGLIEAGRAITCQPGSGKCRFSVVVQPSHVV